MNTFFFDDVQYPEGLFGGKDFFNPIIYSTEEREVGVWTDNKPLYQKTWVFSTPITLNANTWFTTTIDHTALSLDKLVNAFANSGEDIYNGIQASTGTGSYIEVLNYRYAQFDTLTLQYTKTTDVAGSAQYTTLGVPAVHYDGNEKIVGTYFGETLYEKSYIQQLSDGSGSIDISDLNADYAFIESGSYDIGVTKLALNEIIDVNNRLYTYTHINTGSQYLNIDCKNTVSATSTIHITIRYTKTT